MLGLDAKVFEFGGTGSGFYAIHVMYERNTGKSGDVFVEFAAEEEKRITWDKFHSYAKRNGKPRMVGTRKVGLQDSWQGELMAMLFPRGKCLGWKGQSPVITVPVPGMSPFDGFVSDEELQNVLSHASKPGKVCILILRPSNTEILILHRVTSRRTQHRGPTNQPSPCLKRYAE